MSRLWNNTCLTELTEKIDEIDEILFLTQIKNLFFKTYLT